MVRRGVIGLAVSVVAVLAMGTAATGSSTKAELVDSYASPTGDFSLSIVIRHQEVKFEIAASAFRGRYELCVKGGSEKQCDEFRLEPFGDFWTDRVDWARHFDEDVGRYKVVWKRDGDRLGEPLEFEVDGPLEG